MKNSPQTKVALAKSLQIARSSLYYKSTKQKKDLVFKSNIEAIMKDHPAYGHRRVADALGINKKKALRLMRKFNLKPKIRRKQKQPSKPDDVNNPATKVVNIAKKTCPLYTNILWSGDFTYLWFAGRFWYLATVIDVYTREIIGYHIGKHHTTSLIIKALFNAIHSTNSTPTWFHSDQGSEYVSGTYTRLLKVHDIIPSHSKKGCPWHNAYQESFYSNFKLELGDIQKHASIGELIEAIYQQLDYYNKRRIHTSLRMPPITFKETQAKKITTHAV